MEKRKGKEEEDRHDRRKKKEKVIGKDRIKKVTIIIWNTRRRPAKTIGAIAKHMSKIHGKCGLCGSPPSGGAKQLVYVVCMLNAHPCPSRFHYHG